MENDLKYPIGKFAFEGNVESARRRSWIEEIEALPYRLADALDGLSEEQLDTPYRPEGWTVRQVAHHLADSHMNSFIRFKLALTEDHPTIRPYEEAEWAKLPDSAKASPELSLALLNVLHERWGYMLREMSDEDYARTYYHPARGETTRLDYAVGMYAWHGRHHVAHITSLRNREGW